MRFVKHFKGKYQIIDVIINAKNEP